MSELIFCRRDSKLLAKNHYGTLIYSFPAHNNVDSLSKGRWPLGKFAFIETHKHTDDAPNSAYGSYGILIFAVPEREGMGIHAGRLDVADGLGRKGPEHATMGCIRTTDDGVRRLLALHAYDPIIWLHVVEEML